MIRKMPERKEVRDIFGKQRRRELPAKSRVSDKSGKKNLQLTGPPGFQVNTGKGTHE